MVTVLNPKPYKEQPVPEVLREYHVIEWFGKEPVEC